MPAITLDIIIFSIFLALNLLIGLGAGRRVKTLREYATGRKDFSTATVTSTIVATWVGGGFLFYALAQIYTTGLLFIIASLGGTICLLFTGQVLAVRMGEFLNNLSVAEAMGDLYGPSVHFMTVLNGILRSIGQAAIQFTVIAKMLTLLLGFQGPGVTIFAAAIVIFYSAFGGIRSVTLTDVFQFTTFSIFIPILALIVWNNLKDPGQVVQTLTTNPIFSLRGVVGWNPQFLAALGLMLYYLIPGLSPSIFQRIVMARNVQQVKHSFTYAAGIRLLMVMAVTWIAILLLADNPNLNPKTLVDHIIECYAYPGLKGLIALGITAMAMSTADSELNAAAVLAVHSITRLLKNSFKESLIIVRILSFCIGVLGLLLALRKKDILELLLLSHSFYMPLVTVPLLLAIFGFRSSTRAVLIGMAAGAIAVVVWGRYFTYTGINNVIPGMVASLTCFMGSHYLLQEKGGWIGIKEKGPLIAARQARWDAWRALIKNIQHPQPYAYLKKNLPTKEGLYSLFGIYVIGATYASFFTIPEAVVTTYQKLYDHIAHSVLIASAAFITYPAWPSTFKGKRFIAFAWPLGIGYILFVVGSVLVVMSGFHQVQVMIFMLNLVMAALLLYWPLLVLLLTSGILLALGTFKLHAGVVPLLGVADALQFRVIYGIPLFISLLVALVRAKQIQARLVEKNTYLLNIQEETKAQLMGTMGYRQEILQEVEQGELNIFDNVTAAYVRQAVYRMIDYLHLDVKKVTIEQLLDQVKTTLKLQDCELQPQLIINKDTKQEAIHADAAKIKQLLVESIVYIQQHNTTNEPIIIELADATLGHKLDHMEGYTKKLPGLKISMTTNKTFPPSQEVYMITPIQGTSQVTQGVVELSLLENLRIIDAHYGYADISQLTTQVYVIPIDVREIRGKVMELLREPAAVDPEELKHPLAIQLEKELLGKLAGTNVDLAVIHKALKTIQKYHGGVKRKSGEPFFTHPMAAALILLEYSQDQDAVVAALLHDTIEDTQLSLVHIRAMFGEHVAFIVEKVTNLQDSIRRLNLSDHEAIFRLINYEDTRVALVKLSDRLHNMRTIQGHQSLKKQKRIAYETWLFFVPLAMKLELVGLAQELKKLSLEVLGQSEQS
ncbi:MAG: HD domain-containing protein [Bacteroidota bacterium]